MGHFAFVFGLRKLHRKEETHHGWVINAYCNCVIGVYLWKLRRFDLSAAISHIALRKCEHSFMYNTYIWG
jgi:hypothetical protein